jgi:hypothetical protein
VVLGLKCEDDLFVFVLLSGELTHPKINDCGRRAAPSDLSRPAQLSYLAKELVELLDRHEIDRAFYRADERQQNKSTGRAELEGVLMQAAHAHSGLESVKVVKRRINTHLGLQTAAKDVQDNLPAPSQGKLLAYCKEAYVGSLRADLIGRLQL